MQFAEYFKKRPHHLVAGVSVVLLLFFQLSFNQSFGFHRDELLYLSIGHHPAAGYHSVPPFIGLISFLSIKTMGISLFSARIFPALAGAGILWLVCGISHKLNGGLFSAVLAATGTISSIMFLRASGMLQPVIFDILFWTLFLYFFLSYIQTENPKYILLMAISAAIGFLNKYNIAFLIIPLVPIFLFSRYRFIFSSKYFYFAIILGLLIISPNLFWQVNHGFPVMEHMKELRDSQLVNMSPFTFLTEQFLMILPASLIVFPGIILMIFSGFFSQYRIFLILYLLLILEFIVLKGKSYYSAGVYPFLIAASAVIIRRIIKRKVVRILLLMFLLALGYFFLPLGKPVYKPDKMVHYFNEIKEKSGNDAIRRYEDNSYHPLPQDYADMLGWDELVLLASRAWTRVEDPSASIIFCENYGQAGAVFILGKSLGLPEPLSLNDNFRYWLPLEFPGKIRQVVYINDEPGEDVKGFFTEIELIGRISNPLAREYGTGVFLCSGPAVDFNETWKELMIRLLDIEY